MNSSINKRSNYVESSKSRLAIIILVALGAILVFILAQVEAEASLKMMNKIAVHYQSNALTNLDNHKLASRT